MRIRVLLALTGALGLLHGHALAQSKSKSSVTKAPTPKAPAMVCAPGYYKCNDAYGNCCKVGWSCTSDGMCAPPSGGGSSGTSSKAGKSSGPKLNNEGTFQLSGGGGGGGGAKAVKAKASVPSNANIAQWPGFRMTDDGGSEVMVEFSKSTPAPTEHTAAGSITYVFKGAHVLKSNNQNPLITVHFNTPVASARLVPKGNELHLRIEYRAGASAAASSGMRAGADGTGQQFFVKFPSGSWLPKGAEDDDGAAAPTQKLKAKGNAEAKPAAPPPKSESGSKTGPSP